MAALAEAAWSKHKDIRSFDARLQAQLPLYDRAGVYYYDPYDPGKNKEVIDITRQ
jgi:hexosaminidase